MEVKDAPSYTPAFDFWSGLRIKFPRIPKLEAQGPFRGWRAVPMLYAPFFLCAGIAVDAFFSGHHRVYWGDEYAFLRGIVLMQHLHCILTFHLLFFSDAGRGLLRATANGRMSRFWFQFGAVFVAVFAAFAFLPGIFKQYGASPLVASFALILPYNIVALIHGLRQTQGLSRLLNPPANGKAEVPAGNSFRAEKKEYDFLLGLVVLGQLFISLRSTGVAKLQWLMWTFAAVSFVLAARIVFRAAFGERNFWKTIFLSRLLAYSFTFVFPFGRLILCWHAFEYLAVYSAFLKQDPKYARATRSWAHLLFWVPTISMMMIFFPASPLSKLLSITRADAVYDLIFGFNMAVAGMHFYMDARIFKLSNKEHRKVLDPVFFA